MSSSLLLFAACAPGIEPWLEEELSELGHSGKALAGGVELRGPAETLWHLCQHSRLAESVRVRLKPFVARSFPELIMGLERLAWHAYFTRGSQPAVRVTCHKSRLYHSDAVAQRVAEVLARKLGAGPGAPSDGASTVQVRLQADEVQVSIDASGERLHRRGRRTHVAAASLRETLAAAIVRGAGRAGQEALCLWDPFCGAGTIALEWLDLRLGLRPGRTRTFAFEQWPTHDAARYAQWRAALPTVEPPRETLRVYGSDLEPRALEAARANAEAAGVQELCEWLGGDFEAAASRIPLGALVLTNPPYGKRVGARPQRDELLARFDRLLARRRDLRPVVQLLGGGALPSSRLPWEPLLRTSNGGLPVSLRRLST